MFMTDIESIVEKNILLWIKGSSLVYSVIWDLKLLKIDRISIIMIKKLTNPLEFIGSQYFNSCKYWEIYINLCSKLRP